MAYDIHNNLNLKRNQILEVVIHLSTSATRPSNPVDGQITFDTTDRTFLAYNSSTSLWESCSDPNAINSIIGTAPIQVSREDNEVTISVDNATGGDTPTVGVIALGGDLNGEGTTATAPVVSGVGYGTDDETTAEEIREAADKSHDQNTDTGTTSATFKLDSAGTGVTLKSVKNGLEVRNATDSGYDNLRVNNLHVNGELTAITSNEVFIGDNIIVLNNNVMKAADISDGGVDVKRVLADEVGAGKVTGDGLTITGSGTSFTTDLSVGDVLLVGGERRTITKITSNTSLLVDEAFSTDPDDSNYSYANQANARIYFDTSSNVWKVVEGPTSSLKTFPLVRKYATLIGDGTNTSFTITHNLGTEDVTFTMRYAAGDKAGCLTDWKITSANAVEVSFARPPASNEFRVTITG